MSRLTLRPHTEPVTVAVGMTPLSAASTIEISEVMVLSRSQLPDLVPLVQLNEPETRC